MFSEDLEPKGGDNVTALEDTRVLVDNGTDMERVWKELCYGNEETLGDTDEAARWWRYNFVR